MNKSIISLSQDKVHKMMHPVRSRGHHKTLSRNTESRQSHSVDLELRYTTRAPCGLSAAQIDLMHLVINLGYANLGGALIVGSKSIRRIMPT